MTHSCDVNAKHSAGELSPFRYESVRNCLERERAPATAEEGFHKSLETPQGSLSAFIYKSQAALESDEVVDVPSKFPPRDVGAHFGTGSASRRNRATAPLKYTSVERGSVWPKMSPMIFGGVPSSSCRDA